MENKTLNTVLNVARLLIMVIGLILFVMILSGNDNVIGAALNLTYISLAICAIAALGFGIYLFVSNISKNKNGLIGLGAFIAVLLIAYLVSSDAVPNIKQTVTASTAKWVGAGITAFYILLAGVVASIVYAEVRKALK